MIQSLPTHIYQEHIHFKFLYFPLLLDSLVKFMLHQNSLFFSIYYVRGTILAHTGWEDGPPSWVRRWIPWAAGAEGRRAGTENPEPSKGSPGGEDVTDVNATRSPTPR